jgi:hypothetical protein
MPELTTAPAAGAGPWVLSYWTEGLRRDTSHRGPAEAIAELAAHVRRRWPTAVGRPLDYPGERLPALAPDRDEAAINLYFTTVTGDREGYWLHHRDTLVFRCDPAGADPQFVLRAPGGDLLCLCGNDPTLDGFEICRPDGTLIASDDPGWDGHYRCATCDRIISLPTGEVTGRARR